MLFTTTLLAQEKAVYPSKISFAEIEKIDRFPGPVIMKIGNDIKGKKPIPLEFELPENANIKREIQQSNVANKLQEENVPEPLSPSPSASFNGLDDNASIIPPDTKGAAGPNHLMVTLNSQYRIMSKTGTVLSTVSALSFWTGVSPNSGGDPHIIYNHYVNRWMLIAQSDLTASSSLLVAMSTTNDPTGTWNRYAFDIDAANLDGFDYPLVGFNQNWLVVAANKFLLTGGSFSGTQIHLFNIADLAAGAAITIGTNAQRIISGTAQGGSISPVTVFETGAPSTTMYTIQSWNGSSAASRLVTLTGTIPTVVWNTGTAIFPTGAVIWAGTTTGDFTPQLGDTRKINNGDNRPGNFVMVNGKLWWAHHIFLPQASPTRSAIQWWQLQTNGTILQRGLIDDPTGIIHRTYPSLAINANEDVLIGYSTSSVNRYISAAYSYRMPCNAPNTMQSEVIYKDGLSSYYKTFGGTRNRWGDYSNTCLDPTTGDFWTLQEYAGARVGAADNDSRWGTWWARVTPLPAAAASQVAFDAETLTLSETGNTGTCPKYRDYTINIGVICAAVGNATINFSKGGTATDLVDYELFTNSVSYVNGESAGKQLSLRVYDDGNVEPNETIVLNYTIVGTGVVPAANAQTLTITIADNDVAPVSISNVGDVNIFSENFNAAATLPAGWTTTVITGGTTNQWVVSANGGVDFTGNAAHITNNTVTRALAYTTTTTSDNGVVSPFINATGRSNLILTFKYKFNGEPSWDYGRLEYSLNGTTFILIEGNSTSPFVGVTALSTRTVLLPAACNNTNFKLRWRFTCDNIDGTNPPFIIDDINVVSVNTIIATAAATTQTFSVSSGNNETYFITNPGNSIIAKTKNLNLNGGCITASIFEAGVGQATLNTASGVFQRSSKVISITPATANSAVTYEASLYFTNAELAIWGANKLNLKILKVNEGVDLSTTITGTQATLVSPTVVDNSATGGYVEYKGNFTGFSKFLLVSPATVLPITLLNFEASLQQKNAALKWSTSQEIDNTGFNIERSTDGNNFKNIGWVVGNGTSNVINDYNFIDNDLKAGTVYYYRLKQVDVNNRFSYSKIISLQYNGSFVDIATILPNPIKDVLQIRLNKKWQDVEYSIYDASGRLIVQKMLEKADDVIMVNSEKWAKGNYQLVLKINGVKFSSQFVK